MDLEKELQDFMDYCEQIDLTWSTEINVLGLFFTPYLSFIDLFPTLSLSFTFWISCFFISQIPKTLKMWLTR